MSKTDAVGLSALLVSTSKQMQFFVEHARKTDVNIPILCGGAAITVITLTELQNKMESMNLNVLLYTMFDGLKKWIN